MLTFGVPISGALILPALTLASPFGPLTFGALTFGVLTFAGLTCGALNFAGLTVAGLTPGGLTLPLRAWDWCRRRHLQGWGGHLARAIAVG